MRLTLTWDQGSELANHDQIAPLLREGVFFAHPVSSKLWPTPSTQATAYRSISHLDPTNYR